MFRTSVEDRGCFSGFRRRDSQFGRFPSRGPNPSPVPLQTISNKLCELRTPNQSPVDTLWTGQTDTVQRFVWVFRGRVTSTEVLSRVVHTTLRRVNSLFFSVGTDTTGTGKGVVFGREERVVTPEGVKEVGVRRSYHRRFLP